MAVVRLAHCVMKFLETGEYHRYICLYLHLSISFKAFQAKTIRRLTFSIHNVALPENLASVSGSVLLLLLVSALYNLGQGC